MNWLQAVITILAALLGAWAGAYFALSRFKQERGFDRRLEWLEKQMLLLSDSVQHIRGLQRAIQAGDQTAIGEAIEILQMDGDILEALQSQMLMYIDADSPIFAYIIAVGMQVSGVVDVYKRFDLAPMPVQSELLEITIRDLRHGVHLFSVEHRNHLGAGNSQAAKLIELNKLLENDSEALDNLRKKAGLELW